MFPILSELIETRRERASRATRLAFQVKREAPAYGEIQCSEKTDRDQTLTVPEEHDDEDRRGYRAQREEEQRHDAEDDEARDPHAFALELVGEELDAAMQYGNQRRTDPPQRGEQPGRALPRWGRVRDCHEGRRLSGG